MTHKADLAIIHIGAPHAGSTRVQTALSAGRGALLAEGALYPRTLGRTAHMRLAAAMTPAWRTNGPRRQLGVTSFNALRRHRRALGTAFADEMARERPRVILVSSEQLMADASPLRLRRFFARHARRVEIVAWVRRQDEALLASWRNAVKLGVQAEVRVTRPRRDPFDYAARLRPWVRAFGRGAIHLAAYDRAADPAIALLERAAVAWRPPPEIANPSLGGPALSFMRRLNLTLPRYEGGRPNPVRGDLDIAIEALAQSAKRDAPEPQEAAAIRAHFHHSNERLAALFNDGAPLFGDERMISHGEDGLTVDAAIAIAAHLWSFKQAQVDRLRRTARQGATQAPRQTSPTRSNTARRWPLAARSSQSRR